jgi:hypothetical protein
VTGGQKPIAVGWAPLRPSGLFVMSLVAVPIAVSNDGAAGLVFGSLVVALATTLSLKGVSKLEVHEDGLVVRLGPFGVVRRFVPREVALLQSNRGILVSSLRVDRSDGPIIGPFLTVRMWDVWPEDDLRRAGFRFVNRFFRDEEA